MIRRIAIALIGASIPNIAVATSWQKQLRVDGGYIQALSVGPRGSGLALMTVPSRSGRAVRVFTRASPRAKWMGATLRTNTQPPLDGHESAAAAIDSGNAQLVAEARNHTVWASLRVRGGRWKTAPITGVSDPRDRFRTDSRAGPMRVALSAGGTAWVLVRDHGTLQRFSAVTTARNVRWLADGAPLQLPERTYPSDQSDRSPPPMSLGADGTAATAWAEGAAGSSTVMRSRLLPGRRTWETRLVAPPTPLLVKQIETSVSAYGDTLITFVAVDGQQRHQEILAGIEPRGDQPATPLARIFTVDPAYFCQAAQIRASLNVRGLALIGYSSSCSSQTASTAAVLLNANGSYDLAGFSVSPPPDLGYNDWEPLNVTPRGVPRFVVISRNDSSSADQTGSVVIRSRQRTGEWINESPLLRFDRHVATAANGNGVAISADVDCQKASAFENCDTILITGWTPTR